MLRKLWVKVRQVMYRMGLIKGIQNVAKHREISIDEAHYKRVDMWFQLYRGYYADWHKVEYSTINGKRTRDMESLGMPKVIAHEMASLVFNEKCEINISGSVADNIQDVLKANNFYKQFQRYLEYGFAIGGFVSKIYVDDKGIKISYVTADCFFPITYTNYEVKEAVFKNETKKKDKYYTLLEWHLWEGNKYVIMNELYESRTKEELGIKVSLDLLYPGLDSVTVIEGLSRPLFVYIKPNTANNFDLQSPLGVSLFANSLGTLKALDTAFDSFHREFRLGKKRIIVPATAVREVIDNDTGERHRYFDANDEVYEAFDYGDDDQKIYDNSVEIRVEEHAKAIQTLLDILAMQTGFSAGTFTFDGQGVKTATEVVSENSKTYRTKNSHELLVEEGLKDLIQAIIEVAELYKLFSSPDKYEINIDFDDSIAEDRDSNADFYIKLKNSGLISAKTALVRILDYTEEQAEEELRQIAQEKQEIIAASAIDWFGMDRGTRDDKGNDDEA